MGTKVCAKCSEMKPLDAFSKRKASKDGKQLQCKQCKSKYYQDSREAVKAQARKHYERNKQAIKANKREYYRDNKEVIKAKRKDYYENNRGKYNAWTAKRRACKKQATPKWANLSKIEGLYKLAQYLTEKHGRQIHVDHIVPLQNPLVCGLHVEDNLQLLFADENLSKSNSFKVG